MPVVLRRPPSRRPPGERRHLTVLFCDLVESTRLADQFDPEDWTEILSEYQRCCEPVVRRYDGYVADRLGDGLVAYFGWPVAHDDDASRAVRAGLGMVNAVARLRREQGVELHVRVGIHTGTAVVGDIGGGQKGERATGSALHIASRLQSLAQPDTVVISRATFDLVRGYFTYEDLGSHPLKGVAAAVHVYRALGESGAATRLEAVADRGLTPFIGRDPEVTKLLQAWDRAAAGQGQTVQIIGEAGIGKSRMVKVIGERVANSIVFRCSSIDAHTALAPVKSRLDRLLGLDEVEDPGQKLDRLERRLEGLGFPLPDVVPLLASELSLPLPDRYAPTRLSVHKKRQQTLDLLVEWLLRETDRQPLLAIWEDLHWADPSTIELLGLISERGSRRRLLTLLTFRPEFEPPWTAPATLTKLVLGRLDREAVEEMIGHLTGGRPLPRELVDQIVEKTDGVPLFVEELLQTVVDAGIVRDEGDHYAIARPELPITIPATLEGSLMSRLDRLGPAKAIAQRGAVIGLGREFSQDLMRAVLESDVRADGDGAAWRHAQQCLADLVAAGVLRRRRAPRVTYEFRHALIQDAAYNSLLKRTRQAYHLQTARVLEARFPHLVETQPELLAHHYTEAHELEAALDYWQKAGERARDRSANREAIRHFAKGLEVIETLPAGEARDRRELLLRVASITPIIAADGYVSEAAGRTGERALALCRTLGDVQRLFPVLYVLWVTRLVSARYGEALRLSTEFFHEAGKQPDRVPRLMSHRLRGFSRLMIGDLALAQRHLQRALALYDPRQHGELMNQGYGQDPRCACEAFLALVCWLRGNPDEAAEWSRTALEHARAARHSNTWGYVLCFGAATFEVFRRDAAAAESHASALTAFADKEGLPVWMAYGKVLRGWSLVQMDRVGEGLADMRAGLVHFEDPSSAAPPSRSLHMGFMKSLLLALWGDACARAGRADEGLAQIEAAWAFVEATGEAFWKAEIARLHGELLIQARGACHAAEACFQQARDVAVAQGARSLELRATVSLGRLWAREQPAGARRILEESCERCNPGIHTADLRDARRLLQDLAGT